MELLMLLLALARAGVSTLALDPAAGRVRWRGGEVSDELRDAVAAHKPALLALASGEAHVIAPLVLLARLIPPALRAACDGERWQTAYGIAAGSSTPAAYSVTAEYIEARKVAALARLTHEWEALRLSTDEEAVALTWEAEVTR